MGDTEGMKLGTPKDKPIWLDTLMTHQLKNAIHYFIAYHSQLSHILLFFQAALKSSRCLDFSMVLSGCQITFFPRGNTFNVNYSSRSSKYDDWILSI